MAKLSQMVAYTWGRDSQFETALTRMGSLPGCPPKGQGGPGQAGAADTWKVLET